MNMTQALNIITCLYAYLRRLYSYFHLSYCFPRKVTGYQFIAYLLLNAGLVHPRSRVNVHGTGVLWDHPDL